MSQIIKSPGLDAAGLHAWTQTPRYKIAQHLYATRAQGKVAVFLNATGIADGAGRLVGFALTPAQLEALLNHREVRGREAARIYFDQFSRDSGSPTIGRYILVGEDLDIFLDLLAGITTKPARAGIIKI